VAQIDPFTKTTRQQLQSINLRVWPTKDGRERLQQAIPHRVCADTHNSRHAAI